MQSEWTPDEQDEGREWTSGREERTKDRRIEVLKPFAFPYS